MWQDYSRQFLYMQKREDKVMNAWISGVKNAVFRLKSSGVASGNAGVPVHEGV